MRPFFPVLFFMSIIFFNAVQVDADTRLCYIMNELDKSILTVVDGVMREDFAQVESGARAIAGHEKAPLSERKRIAGYLKSRISKFKRIDDTLHNNALALAAASARHDIKAVLKNLINVQKGCVACHSAFRIEVRRLFNK